MMTTAALVLAAVSFVAVVFLAFGYAGLLALVRELQDKLHDAATLDAPRHVDRFVGDRRSFVLVTEKGCFSCEERIADLVGYLEDRGSPSMLPVTVLQAAPADRPQTLPPQVEFVNDAALVGQLAVGVVPLGLVFDPSGAEIGRSVLGDRLSFDRMLTWAEGQDQLEARAGGRV